MMNQTVKINYCIHNYKCLVHVHIKPIKEYISYNFPQLFNHRKILLKHKLLETSV